MCVGGGGGAQQYNDKNCFKFGVCSSVSTFSSVRSFNDASN